MRTFISVVALSLFANSVMATTQNFEGPYQGTVQRVVDGDTFVAEVEIWPNIRSSVHVRIRGIQAPEARGAACEEEDVAADRATEILEEELFERNPGGHIELDNVESDVWSGRVVADVFRPNNRRRTNIVGQLVNRGAVVEWTPDMDDVPWCLLLSNED